MDNTFLESNSNEIYKQIQKELRKGKEEIDEYISIVKEWTKTQPHLPEVPSDAVIRSFLLFNKFSIEKTKQKLDMYYSVRNIIPEMFDKHPLSPEMIEQSKITYCIPLPKLAKDSRRILYSKFSDSYGPNDLNHLKYMCHILNIFEVLIREDLFLGSHFIFDAASFKLGHVSKMSPMVMKKSSIVMEKVFSNRVASIHCINYHPSFETTLSFFRSFLPAKISSRLHVHRTADALFDIFPKSILPKDIGGEEDSLSELNGINNSLVNLLWVKNLL